ncbi:MAG: DUF3291 domain-containing protein [Anaerolineae bacterium]|nr:DUF3291 domain-containing protein [Anaerolineae bacterium]
MPASAYHLAQVNVGYTRAPLDDPLMADFVDNLTRINHLGSQTPGFVWQLTNDQGDSTSFRFDGDDDLLINMTVWESIEALYEFTYKSGHVDFFRRRREWFATMERPHLVLWWVPAGHQPTLEEAAQRLAHLEAHGPTPLAFTFKQRFTIEEMLAAAPQPSGD